MKDFVPELSLRNYPNKTRRVYEILLEDIATRKFQPGERLIEKDLADKLGVSKTPVREALSRLERGRLVEVLPYRGAFVAKLSYDDVIEIYDLRGVMEGLAARRAVKKIEEKQIEELRSIIQSLEDCVNNGDLESYSVFDLKFHDLLGSISGNSRLLQMLQSLRNQIKILMSTSVILPGRAANSLAEHERIMDAIVKGDADLAERFAREHVKKVKEAVLENLKIDNVGGSWQ